MIERHWKGVAKRERAKEYIAHLQNETFKQIATIPGCMSAKILERDTEEGIEFLIITEWQDVESIKQFAGSNIETAVVPELVQGIMITYDKNVRHYKIGFKIKTG
jgi:heme-degrading monooxygenase HmoA